MRSRKLPMAFALLFAFALAGTAFAAQPGAMPDAYSPNPAFTFEGAVEGSEVTHDFVIRNKGEADLVIAKVKTG